MSGAHTHALTVHGHGPIHRLPAQVKLVAMFGFILAVVATPPEQIWALGIHFLLLAAVLVFSEVPFGHFLKRIGVEVPFVLFALALPFVGSGPAIEVLGVAVAADGLLAAWNIIAKATLGVGASVLLVSTTEVSHILAGLRRLRMPAVMVAIAGFMIRYLEVIGDEVRRMRVAMTARGYAPTWLGQTRALATAGGALFIRSYERGERVHQAMLARGFTGTMPTVEPKQPAWAWLAAIALPAGAWIIAIAAVLS